MLSAREFGWIGIEETVARLETTVATLDRLERFQGHFLNWYDTITGEPLHPRYVSTVDSGNLAGHLLAVSQGCGASPTRTRPRGGRRHQRRGILIRRRPIAWRSTTTSEWSRPASSTGP